MHKTPVCVEKKDFYRLVDISRQYAGDDLKKCYVFNKKGYTAEFLKEKKVNNLDCIIFGWSNYSFDDKKGYDLYGIKVELERLKNGYILMEFEDNMLVDFRDKSKIDELKQAMNIDKVITRDDFAVAFGEENENAKENEEEEEEEFE